MADDLGFETLGSYGGASYETPVLDELAATGMKFNYCYSQPLCTPSRVKIMTGRYNFRNYTHCGVLPKSEITFGHLLKNAGYATAVAGKWQLYGGDNKVAQVEGQGCTPGEAGFDDYLLWQLTRQRRYGERYADPLVEGKENGLQQLDGAYGPDVFTDFLLDFIESHSDEPFFAYYPMALTHHPFVPTPDSPGWDGDRYAPSTDRFADMVAYMDKTIGRIVAKLDELGLRENTLILFTGDNGTHRSLQSTMTDGTIIEGNKGTTDDGGTHVPLIVNWTGVTAPGSVNDDLIDFSDILPTLVEITGGTLPNDRVIDGRSFARQIRGERGNPRDWVFCDYNSRCGGRAPSRFVRNHRWKLYSDERFYDVLSDRVEKSPLERRTLSPEIQQIWDDLQRVLDDLDV